VKTKLFLNDDDYGGANKTTTRATLTTKTTTAKAAEATTKAAITKNNNLNRFCKIRNPKMENVGTSMWTQAEIAKRSTGMPKTYVDWFHNEEGVKKMHYRPLGKTGLTISYLGLGCAQLGAIFRGITVEDHIKIVHEAVKQGVNYLDCAPFFNFGRAEEVLGQALKDIPRQAYFLTTKVGKYSPDVLKMYDYSYSRTEESVNNSLNKLQVDCIDIVQIQDVDFVEDRSILYSETLPALQKLKSEGKLRFIGVTGYDLAIIKEVINDSPIKIDTVLSPCHCSLNDVSIKDYTKFFEENEVGVISASPVAMGLLSPKGAPSFHPAGEALKAAAAEAAKICDEGKVDIVKLAVHFALSQPEPASTLTMCNTLDALKKQIKMIQQNLWPQEKSCMEQVLNVFASLEKRDWVGEDRIKFYEKCKEKKEELEKKRLEREAAE